MGNTISTTATGENYKRNESECFSLDPNTPQLDTMGSRFVTNVIVNFILYTVRLRLSPTSSTVVASTSSPFPLDHSFNNLQLLHNVRVMSRVTGTFQTRSLMGCLTMCLGTPECRSISFNSDTSLCHTNEQVMSSPGAVVTYETSYKYIEITQRLEWHMIFRATEGINREVYSAWGNTGRHDDVTHVTEDTIGCLTVDGRMPCDKHLRTWRLDAWNHVSLVKYAFYTDSQEVFFVTFNASGINTETRDNSFRRHRRVDSKATKYDGYSGSDLNTFSIPGNDGLRCRFCIMLFWKWHCNLSYLWMWIQDGYRSKHGCYDEVVDAFPIFKYTKGDQRVKINGSYGKAQVFAVFFKYED